MASEIGCYLVRRWRLGRIADRLAQKLIISRDYWQCDEINTANCGSQYSVAEYGRVEAEASVPALHLCSRFAEFSRNCAHIALMSLIQLDEQFAQ